MMYLNKKALIKDKALNCTHKTLPSNKGFIKV